MADGVYSVETPTYVKLMLHAAKWPANSVCGILLGQEKGQGFSILDAVPLFHHEAPLAPLLEVACAMVDASCQKSQKWKIIGFYYAGNGYSPSDSNTGISHFVEKVADKIDQNCARACVLVVDHDQLGTETETGLQILRKDVKRGWIRMENRVNVANGASKVLTQGLQQNVQKDVVDFEEHLEDPSKDWRNPHIVDLLKLNL
ncbi:hypothetical protein KXD40_006499 [Peronospora effusa]|uniref:MPN domain-containing protein n=1 Tax=Peronospora effusa TaxID=542832 RepID=A0A3M6VCR9_9STRA|nr:hypothetical protein DD238_005602 [Peronospora effusa]RQM12858.1 hypothetical protein DD237_006105 [Peronospora effusa]UIZ25413.1 hypothetical protein KXD40_006499 [Peronospora effusa]CAI5716039.1 unnamed protein product [Peronospora effusa]